jgi:tripeptidyl-peptidase-1
MRALLCLGAVFSLVHATPLTARDMIVHDRRDGIPSGFAKVGAAPSSQMLKLRLALTQGDLAGLEDRLMAISTPTNPAYRQWLSKEEVHHRALQRTMRALTAYALAG